MKNILLVSLLILFCCSCSTKKKIITDPPITFKPSNPLIYVKYAVLNLYFEEPEAVYAYGPGELFIADTSSYFRWNYFYNDSFPIPDNATYIKLPSDVVDDMGNIIQMNFKQKVLVQRESFGKYFYTKESIPNMEWKISDDRKVIADMTTILATTSFRGRQYSAWFTPDIPVPNGPWKFHGLPGLILEISDSDGDFVYSAIKVEYPYQGKGPIISKGLGKELTWTEFIFADQIVKSELESETRARNTDRNGDFQVTVFDQIRQEKFTSKSSNY